MEEEEEFNPKSPKWYEDQQEKQRMLLRVMMESVNNGTTTPIEFANFLMEQDIKKLKDKKELRRVPPRAYTMGVDPYNDDFNVSIGLRTINTINESFNPEDPEMKRQLLEQMATSSLKLLYETLGHKTIPAENERVQYINQITNHSYDRIKKICEGEIKRIEEQAKTTEYLSTLTNEELLTVLDRIGANYSDSVFTREEVSDFLLLNVRLSSIKDAIINFDYEDEDQVTHSFEAFVKRRTPEECIMLLNMVGWDIENDDDVKGLREDLLLQEYELVFKFYLQLTK